MIGSMDRLGFHILGVPGRKTSSGARRPLRLIMADRAKICLAVDEQRNRVGYIAHGICNVDVCAFE